MAARIPTQPHSRKEGTAYSRMRYQTIPRVAEQKRAANRIWAANNPEKRRATDKRFHKNHPHYSAKRVRALRKLTIEKYGGKCKCCGAIQFEFLTIDHVNGGGLKHRREVTGMGSGFYYWLKKNNFPQDGFRCLCWNCNAARGIFGYCPHDSEAA